MGNTAENLHDRYPTITKERADAYAVRSQAKTVAAYEAGKIQPDLVPVATRSAEDGWGLATTDEPVRAGTTMESLAGLKTPFRPHGRVTAGNAAGINDGATAALLADEETARELGLPVRMRLVSFAFSGVEPEVMGAGPIPATEKALGQGRPDHRRHRRLRDQRGVRGPGALAARALRHRRRRPAREPVRRRDRHGPPAGLLRRAPDDPARQLVRRASRGPLRHDHHVRRHRHGRHRDLGEPATGTETPSEHRLFAQACRGARPPDAERVDRGQAAEGRPAGRPDPGPDHPRQRRGPHQAQHVRAPARCWRSTPPSTPPWPTRRSTPSA